MPSTLRESAEVFAGLARLGISAPHALILCRAARTLHTWSERECNGNIQRDETTGKCHYYYTRGPRAGDRISGPAIPDRESGALRRIAAVLQAYPGLAFHHQGDPRGAPLYIYRVADLRPGADIASCYSSIGSPVY